MNGRSVRKTLEELEGKAVSFLLHSPEEIAEQEKAVVELAKQLTTDDRIEELMKGFKASGVLEEEADEEDILYSLKQKFENQHLQNKCNCLFCTHKEKLKEVIGDRFYLLPRLT